ncbi:MAG: hypothetical protein P4L11_04985 [Geothrix sp.]|nr:hypothetical protein [Geothrix sp.]
MRACRSVFPAALLAAVLPLAAQSPSERIHSGFKILSTGSWEAALKEWARDGVWVDGEGRLQARLEALVPGTRSIGRWESVNLPYLSPTWQRHWMIATFDQGPLFFLFDYVHHNGQWRLVALQVAQDPEEVLPHLDLLPSLQAPRETH